MIDSSVDSLHAAFAPRVRLLQERIARDGLPFVVFETRRNFSRSHALFLKGRDPVTLKVIGATVTNARAGQSAHNWGLAADFVLDPNSDWWSGQRPTGPWDTGSATRPLPKLAWEKFGRLVKDSGLVWGGHWTSFKDLPHVEMPAWKTYRPKNWLDLATIEVAAGR